MRTITNYFKTVDKTKSAFEEMKCDVDFNMLLNMGPADIASFLASVKKIASLVNKKPQVSPENTDRENEAIYNGLKKYKPQPIGAPVPVEKPKKKSKKKVKAKKTKKTPEPVYDAENPPPPGWGNTDDEYSDSEPEDCYDDDCAPTMRHGKTFCCCCKKAIEKAKKRGHRQRTKDVDSRYAVEDALSRERRSKQDGANYAEPGDAEIIAREKLRLKRKAKREEDPDAIEKQRKYNEREEAMTARAFANRKSPKMTMDDPSFFDPCY